MEKKQDIQESVGFTPDNSESNDEAAIALQKAAELMAKAASDRANRPAIMKEVEGALSKVKMIDFPELVDSPVVQAFLQAMDTTGMRPGESRNRGTLAEVSRDWTMDDVRREVREGRMKLRHFTPNRNMTITWNNVRLHLPANEEVEVADCFYAEYMRVMGAEKQAKIDEAYLLAHSDTPPDISYMSPQSAEVRAWSIQGRRFGVPAATLATGKISVERAPVEGGSES